jgi:hypothetical protein
VAHSRILTTSCELHDITSRRGHSQVLLSAGSRPWSSFALSPVVGPRE